MSASKMQEDDSKGSAVLVPIEMGRKTWLLSIASSDKPKKCRRVSVEAGNYVGLQEEVRKAVERMGVQQQPVVFCYEAGRDGFYPYRQLRELGHEAWVVDSSSIEVNRRTKRAKSDGVDVEKLQGLMQRQWRGEEALKVVRVPGEAEEDARQRTRERKELQVERGRLRTRMQSLLFAQGWREFPEGVREMEKWLLEHRGAVRPHLYERLEREMERLRLVDSQLKAVSQALHRSCRLSDGQSGSEKIEATAHRLQLLRGIGETTACVLSHELFGWREFNNRREVGAMVGATPTPYNSGDSQREQGIDKGGNRRVRSLMVEVAWRWLDLQPESALTHWFHERFARGKRNRRVGIVAVARKLCVALWQYLKFGVVPKGAVLKSELAAKA